MGLRLAGSLFLGAGIVGAVMTWRLAPATGWLFFALESGVAIVAGLTMLGMDGLRHGYHKFAPGAPPGDMDPALATDPVAPGR